MLEIVLFILSYIGCLYGVIGWFIGESMILLLIWFAFNLVTIFVYGDFTQKTGMFILFLIGGLIGRSCNISFWIGGIHGVLFINLLLYTFILFGSAYEAVSHYKDQKKK